MYVCMSTVRVVVQYRLYKDTTKQQLSRLQFLKKVYTGSVCDGLCTTGLFMHPDSRDNGTKALQQQEIQTRKPNE